MYLDDVGHVQCDRLGGYIKPAEALAFVRDFPRANLAALRTWAIMKSRISAKFADGTAAFTINGVREERSEYRRAEDLAESIAWKEVADAIAALSE
jgi:hypothetical protein